MADWASSVGCQFRVIGTSALLDHELPLHDSDEVGIARVLAGVQESIRDLRERAPAYLDDYGMHSYGRQEPLVECAAAAGVAAQIIRCATSADTHGRVISIPSDARITLQGLYTLLGTTLGVNLVLVGNRSRLNTLDRALQQRIGDLEQVFDISIGSVNDAAAVAALVQEVLVTRSTRIDQDRHEADTIWQTLERRTIDRDDRPLEYLVGGDGPPLIMINALGQGLKYWSRLLPLLACQHRVMIWQPRGLECDGAMTLEEQVADLEAIILTEHMTPAVLVGWCTGPKVAAAFCARRPDDVSAMIFLNPSFKCSSAPAQPDTDYERTIEPICRMVVQRPALAAAIRAALDKAVIPAARAADESEFERAEVVAAGLHPQLSNEVRVPFRSAQTFLRYAQQVVAFWDVDTRQRAAELQVPVLIVTGECDRVASPHGASAVAPMFPKSRLVELQGISHYGLYDRPELIASLIMDFLRE
jgi:pimeloyl-ACP methyl ester carboxylesterase